ncbi:hypothetical protein B0H10DRAFT_2197308 [Mycena sp. CBHHK59/15]|nr:hypothetical protein B0H10DRAFT_2197305 [Mycena sp. CBHHK59/15]KAJ6595429.1 hypothetical protein B0H10DRAFT_2197308 [Mycena sp. CBHHK59/15]
MRSERENIGFGVKCTVFNSGARSASKIEFLALAIKILRVLASSRGVLRAKASPAQRERKNGTKPELATKARRKARESPRKRGGVPGLGVVCGSPERWRGPRGSQGMKKKVGNRHDGDVEQWSAASRNNEFPKNERDTTLGGRSGRVWGTSESWTWGMDHRNVWDRRLLAGCRNKESIKSGAARGTGSGSQFTAHRRRAGTMGSLSHGMVESLSRGPRDIQKTNKNFGLALIRTGSRDIQITSRNVYGQRCAPPTSGDDECLSGGPRDVEKTNKKGGVALCAADEQG